MTGYEISYRRRAMVSEDQLQAFRRQALKGSFEDMLEDTGCWCLCQDVSAEFIKFMGRGRLLWLEPASDVPGYPPEAEEGHCVAEVDGTVYDWTARQYNRLLPVPFTWRVADTDLVETTRFITEDWERTALVRR
ncbi:MAG TPA: hypothetical protein ENH11_04910 [Candidatus Acetothermia bacterium]|nr:hypothetical protein [Candidatus Acetothermia bacterium]